MVSRESAGEVMAPVLQRNVRALIDRRRAEEQRKPWQERLADRVTRFTGSMRFVGIHLVLFGGWIGWNLPFSPLPRFDPSLVILAMAASVEAIFLSTFILISQNRMQAIADRRADLDLQVNLLSEHEITRLIRLVKRIAERMEIDESESRELPELERDVQPEKVLEHIENVAREEGAAPKPEQAATSRLRRSGEDER
jgi:uncharacterized membrane protein